MGMLPCLDAGKWPGSPLPVDGSAQGEGLAQSSEGAEEGLFEGGLLPGPGCRGEGWVPPRMVSAGHPSPGLGGGEMASC